MPRIKTLLKAHPELIPAKSRRRFQPTIISAGRIQRPADVTPAEKAFASMLKRGGIAYIYEPFILGLELRKTGTVRSFQPDFWLPELGLVVEICARAYVKNRKVRLTDRGWPGLSVLVLEDREVKALAASRLTRWQLIEVLAAKLQAQHKRVAKEGDDPKGYASGPRRRTQPSQVQTQGKVKTAGAKTKSAQPKAKPVAATSAAPKRRRRPKRVAS